MERIAISSPASVAVVDDVMACGATLCAVLQLLDRTSVHAENVDIMVVAELPVHRGRGCFRQHGFGNVGVQNPVTFTHLNQFCSHLAAGILFGSVSTCTKHNRSLSQYKLDAEVFS
jgi:hypothetical protein